MRLHLRIRTAAALIAFACAACDANADLSASDAAESLDDADTDAETPPSDDGAEAEPPEHGFAGRWLGKLACDYREETSDGVKTGSETAQSEAHFDAQGRLLLPGPDGELQPQDREGLRTEYALEGGGIGSRVLVALDETSDARHYTYRTTEDSTHFDSGSSYTIARRIDEELDYTLTSEGLDVSLEAVNETKSFFTGPTGSVESNSIVTLSCTGTFTRAE